MHCIRNVLWHWVVGLALFTLYILDNNEHDVGIDAKFILIFSGSLKIAYLALGYIIIYWLWVSRRFNSSYYPQFAFALELLYFPWSIYCLIKFFNEDNHTRDNAVLLYIGMLYLMIEGMIILFITSMVLMALIIGGILLWWLVRSSHQLEQERLQRNNEVSNLISRLDVLNVAGNRFDEGEHWWIWFDSFHSDIEVIRLEWIRKHYFHKPWIVEWIQSSNVCPICKTEITKDILEYIDNNTSSHNHTKSQGYGTIISNNGEANNLEIKQEDDSESPLDRTRI